MIKTKYARFAERKLLTNFLHVSVKGTLWKKSRKTNEKRDFLLTYFAEYSRGL